MKVLLFSDLHVQLGLVRELVKKSANVDVVIGAGDFAVMHQGLTETIEVLRRIEKPCVFVPGNGETFNELKSACKDWKSCTVLHGTGTNIDGIEFFGIGGGIPVTPFGSWSYDFTEQEAMELLKDCPENAVLISHSPPKYILDVASSGKNLGSTSVKNAIEVKKPKLVVCGHIHESGGKREWFNETLVVNAGPKGIIIEINSLSHNTDCSAILLE